MKNESNQDDNLDDLNLFNESDFDLEDEDEDEDISNIMNDYDLDNEEAEEVLELMDSDGLDEEEAIEIHQAGGYSNRGGGFCGVISTCIIIGLIIWGISSLFGGSNKIDSDAYQKGDMINSGGTPTYRYNNTPSSFYDYESNDQPVGFYGSDTMYACNGGSGNCYDLDVDTDGENIERIYFPKGGWVDVDYSDCEDGYCYIEDENGTEWELEY